MSENKAQKMKALLKGKTYQGQVLDHGERWTYSFPVKRLDCDGTRDDASMRAKQR